MEKNLYITPSRLSDTGMPTTNLHAQYLQGRKQQLNQQSHVFMIAFGMFIGAILALFVGYHLNMTLFNVAVLLSLPIILTYMLRKIYIHTVVHIEHQEIENI